MSNKVFWAKQDPCPQVPERGANLNVHDCVKFKWHTGNRDITILHELLHCISKHFTILHETGTSSKKCVKKCKVESVKLFQARKKMWTCDIEVDTWLRQVCGVSLVTGTKYLCMVSWYCNINNDYDLSGPARWAGCCSPCRYCRHNNLHFTSHSLITHC